MARALANLIGNAVKYGRDGKMIRINVKVTKLTIEIKVVNYGMLISKDDLEHIFERFYRAESSRSRETGGTGLGLDITKRIVELHDGSIYANSGVNGTEFVVTLLRYKEEGEGEI